MFTFPMLCSLYIFKLCTLGAANGGDDGGDGDGDDDDIEERL